MSRTVLSSVYKRTPAFLLRMTDVPSQSSIRKRSPLHLWGVTNFEYEENPHPTIKLRIPGLSHESFDRDWNPKLTSIMMTSALARAVAFQRPLQRHACDGGSASKAGHEEETIFLDYPKLAGQYYTFMSSSEYLMSRGLYDNSVPKSLVDMKFMLGHVGNSSVANRCEFYACGDSDGCESGSGGGGGGGGAGGGLLDSGSGRTPPLWTNTYQIVCVDKATRRPAKLPDWFREKYVGKGCMDAGFILRPSPRPADTFSLPFTVHWTDTDNYKHTNFSTYARWAVDTLHAALLAESRATGPSPSSSPSALLGISKAIVARGLHKMHVTYLRECLEGEQVQTHVWQEAGEERELVRFSVVKEGEDVCQMKLWYFPADE